LSQFASAPASLVFVQSPEDLEEVAVRQVGNIQSVNSPDPREHVADLHVIDSNEVMQAREIRNEMLPRIEAEEREHEIFGAASFACREA
jgi:hypothetical protein